MAYCKRLAILLPGAITHFLKALDAYGNEKETLTSPSEIM